LRATLNIPVFFGKAHLGDIVFTSSTPFSEEQRPILEGFAYRLLAMLNLRERSLLERFIHVGSFMPLKEARNLLATNVEHMLNAAHLEPATVLLVDIRGFSKKVNKYFEDSTDKTIFPKMLNEFRKTVIMAIWEEGGIVDKFIGDAVMAVFLGRDTSVAKKAINSAIKMVKSLDEFNNKFQAEWKNRSGQNDWEPWDIGIGITTGDVLLGIFGIDYRYEFTAIGKLVNKVARIVDEARGIIDDHEKIQTKIIVDDAIYAIIPPAAFTIQELGNFMLKGIEEKNIRSKLYYIRIPIG